MEAWNDEANWWPIRLLKGLARYPHENKTWLYADHSILWSDPPQPFASSTRMTSVLLLRPKLIPPDAQVIHVRKNGHIQLWGVYPLHHEELELKQRQGSSGIETLFEENGITAVSYTHLDVYKRQHHDGGELDHGKPEFKAPKGTDAEQVDQDEHRGKQDYPKLPG